MASKIARITSQFVNEDVDTLKDRALASSRWQREYFSALRYNVDYGKYSLGGWSEVPYRRFDCENVWMIRGADHLEEDLANFVEGVRSGKMGYLTAATGLGKSTGILSRVVSTVGCRAVSLQPKDKFAKTTADYMIGLGSADEDQPAVAFQYLKRQLELGLEDLTYMSAPVFLILLLIVPGWLDRYGVGLVYVDEAHFDSDEYDVIRCLTMTGYFGKRTVCFATATPPMGVSCEVYRKARFVKETFPKMEPNVKLKDVMPKTQLSGDRLKGSVLVFAVNNDHARALYDYYVSCDLDVTLHTTDNFTTEWFEVQKKFMVTPVGTRVLVTTTLFDYGVNLWVDQVINFRVSDMLVSAGPGEPIKRKLRGLPDFVNVQREGRAGRMGPTAKILEMERVPTKNDQDTSAQDIRRYCWFQLFNIKSNSESYRTAAMLFGDVSERKLWNVLSAGLHPLLLLKYMTPMGLVKDVFRDGLKLYFPDGFRLEVDTSESYDQATAEFVKYSRVVTGQSYRIPLSEDNYFLDDMIYIDHVARKKSAPVDAPRSVCFEDVPVKKVRMSEVKLPMGLHEKLRLTTLNEESSEVSYADTLEREETKAKLEGYESYYSPNSPGKDFIGYPVARKNSIEMFQGKSGYFAQGGLDEKKLSMVPVQRHSCLVRTPSTEAIAPRDKSITERGREVMKRAVESRQVPSKFDFNEYWTDLMYKGFCENRSKGEPVRVEIPTFHPNYPVVHKRQMSAPAMVMEPSPPSPTFAQVYKPASIEYCDESLVFPFSDASVKPDKYVRPDQNEREMVWNMIDGKVRISDMGRRVREKYFHALIRVWNMNVVDTSQFGESVERSVMGYSSRSRKGPRYDGGRLVILFHSFAIFGLTICTKENRVVVKGHVATIETLQRGAIKLKLVKVLASKDPSVAVDWKSATRSVEVLGPSGVAVACASLVEEAVLDAVVGVHIPRLRQVNAVGQCIGYAYDYGGVIVTMGHVVGTGSSVNDLVKLSAKKSCPGDAGNVPLRVPEVDEWLFIVVGFPNTVPSFAVTYGGMTFGMVGPLKVRSIDKTTRVCRCKGYSKPGLSGSPVVSAVNGNLVGLLWGEYTDNREYAVSML